MSEHGRNSHRLLTHAQHVPWMDGSLVAERNRVRRELLIKQGVLTELLVDMFATYLAVWSARSPADSERCLDCRAVLVPCTCRPDCPGGMCPRRECAAFVVR